MRRGRGRALLRAPGALRTLCALTALTAVNTLSAPRASAEPPAGDEPAALLAEVEATGQAQEIATAAQWEQALLEQWQIRYGAWAKQTCGEVAAPLRAQLRIEGVPEGLLVRVGLQAPVGGSAQSAQVVVWSSSVQAGAQAAAGELAFLLASGAGFPQPQQQPPRLASVIGVDSLELLRAGPAGPGQGPAGNPPRTESLAVDADPGGVRILLADRFVSLGPLLDISTRTAADLLFAPRLPPRFVPAALTANSLGEPAVYDAGSGELLLFAAGAEAPLRLPTGVTGPTQAGKLAGGSLATLQARRLTLLHRHGKALDRTEIALPTGLAVALAAESPGALCLYDIAERRIRLLDTAGHEIGSVKPLLPPSAMPLPQLLRAPPEGGYLLGAAAELWSFDPAGLPRWRLRELGTAPRESLPAFYAAAPASVPDESPPAFFLLDPLGRRLLRFVERGRPGAIQAPESSLEQRLADGYERLAADADSRAELIGLCLREGLLLQAHHLFSLGQNGSQAARALQGRILETQAQRLSELARELEGELRLPEAEQAYNGALALLRELRGLDPVERRFPRTIAELTEARNSVREILTAERLLEAGPVSVTRTAEGVELRLPLVNPTAHALADLTVDLRLAIGATGPAALRRQWGSAPGPLLPGGQQVLRLPVAVADGLGSEDLLVQVHGLCSWRQGQAIGQQHILLPALLPSGTAPRP